MVNFIVYICIYAHLIILLSLTGSYADYQANDIENAINIQKEFTLDRNIQQQKNEIEGIKKFKGGSTYSAVAKEERAQYDGVAECYYFNSIYVQGNNSISSNALAKITNKYLNKCITMEVAMAGLLEDIIKLYHSKGYILAIPYLPEQQLKNGFLTVVIKEGILEDINFDKNIFSNMAVKLAFGSMVGKAVNMRKLEQALENINSSGKYKVVMDLKPGTTSGYSILELKAEKGKIFGFSLGVNTDYNTINKASQPSQQYRNTLNINIADVVANDTLNLSASYDFKGTNDIRSGSLGLTYAIPISSWNITFSNNNDANRRIVKTLYSHYISRGFTTMNYLGVSKVMYRDQYNLFKVRTKANYYHTKNYLDDLLLKQSSYDLYYADLGVEYQYFSKRVNLYGNLSYMHGQPLFGEDKQGKNKQSVPQNLFDLVKLNWYTTVILSSRFNYINRLKIQYSKDTLYSINDFVVISSEGVRGYDGISSNSASGFVNQNELSIKLVEFQNSWLSKINLVTAIDIGASINENSFHLLNHKGHPLYSWYAELNTQGRISTSIGYGRPITRIPFSPKGHEVFRAKISIGLI